MLLNKIGELRVGASPSSVVATRLMALRSTKRSRELP
jgi:hypothetical protein